MELSQNSIIFEKGMTGRVPMKGNCVGSVGPWAHLNGRNFIVIAF